MDSQSRADPIPGRLEKQYETKEHALNKLLSIEE